LLSFSWYVYIIQAVNVAKKLIQPDRNGLFLRISGNIYLEKAYRMMLAPICKAFSRVSAGLL
jgi:hypothetical protein